jgi:acyl-CoA synthetase (AMP-forming)/AMP-acid ligase II
MKSLLRRPSFGSFLFAHAQLDFNDDALTLTGCVDQPTVLLATPTFLGQYLKRIPLDAFDIVRRVVSGAEKLPANLRDAFRARFGCEFLEGYSSMEASPVVNFNLPRPARGAGADTVQHGSREGSAGRLLPDVALRLEELHGALASDAVPNLWMPRIVIQVAQLLALASGKLDLAACLKLAEGAPAAP